MKRRGDCRWSTRKDVGGARQIVLADDVLAWVFDLKEERHVKCTQQVAWCRSVRRKAEKWRLHKIACENLAILDVSTSMTVIRTSVVLIFSSGLDGQATPSAQKPGFEENEVTGAASNKSTKKAATTVASHIVQ